MMPRNKRDIYDRRFFNFRDQLTPRYGYENAKKLAYAFIKHLRKAKVDLNWEVGNLRCCDTSDPNDVLKYTNLWNKSIQGETQIDEKIEINGKIFMIGFDYGYD